MYGIGAVKYKDFVVGYIEKGSFDLGGQKPEAAKIEAEQVPGAPVLVIAQSNGSIAPTFNVIQMDFDNLHKLLGKLTLTETAKIECTLEVAMPEDGSQPYGVFDTESIPSEWEQYKLPAAEEATAQIQTGEG